ncbi:MAG: hypothetical protein LBP75_01860 [Planctomycetota bacterium]|jgi:hypothetical protein|nr:hypothetical protein [Planctomycetota bacterium]
MDNEKDLTYSAAIEQVMLANGYFAPLKIIYREIGKYKNMAKIKGKTPDMTIQERVQRDKRFTRVGLGVYALTEFLYKLPQQTAAPKNAEIISRRHAEIQGMLLEIGNNNKEVENTYTNDKKYIFNGKTLGNLATLAAVPLFTYEKIIKKSVTFTDVIWFNNRGFPTRVFEVEHSTDFRDGFIKFMELQDFITEFYCIAAAERRDKFEREKEKNAFKPIAERLKFRTYDDVEADYNHLWNAHI